MSDDKKEHRCTGHCCRAFSLIYSYSELVDMLDPEKPVTRCEDCEIIAQMVIPIDPPEGKTNTFPSGTPAYWYTCKHLLSNNDCDIYERRPRMCKEYPYGKKCEYPGCTYTGTGEGREKDPIYPSAINVLERSLPFSHASTIQKSSVPGKRRVVYAALNETTCVYVDQVHAKPDNAGPWRATLHNDYTQVAGPPGETISHAVEYLNLELSLIKELVYSCAKTGE